MGELFHLGRAAFVLTVLMFNTQTQAQSPSEGEPLSLKSYLEQVEKSDPSYQNIIIEKLRLRFNRDLTLPSRELLFSVRNQYGFSSDEGSLTHTFTGGLEKELFSTGTRLSGSFTVNDQEDRDENTATFLIEQDLWKNAFGRQHRTLEKVLDREDQLIELEVAESYEDYIALQIHSYLDLRLAHLNVEAAQELYRDSQALLNNLKKRLQSNIANQMDVDRIALQSLSRQEELISAQVGLQEQQERLAARLNFDKSRQILPETPAEFESAEIEFAKERELLLSESRSARMARYQQQASELNVSYNEARLGPELSLLAGFQYDDSERFSESVNRTESLLGVALVWPIGDTRTEAMLKQSQLVQARSNLQNELFLRETTAMAVTLESKIARQKELVGLLEEKTRLATRVANSMQSRYKIGQTDLNSLISAQNERAQTRYSHLTERIRLSKYVVDWLSLTDRLVTQQKIDAM